MSRAGVSADSVCVSEMEVVPRIPRVLCDCLIMSLSVRFGNVAVSPFWC